MPRDMVHQRAAGPCPEEEEAEKRPNLQPRVNSVRSVNEHDNHKLRTCLLARSLPDACRHSAGQRRYSEVQYIPVT
jgi:hypothetical protein